MVAHEGEGVDRAFAALYDLAESIRKFRPVEAVNEEIALT